MTHEIRTPADLQRLMRSAFPPSDEQFAAITAPLEPAVVVAGAGFLADGDAVRVVEAAQPATTR